MPNIFLIAGMGVVGVLSRYGIDTLFTKWNESFPYSTLVINLLGSFIAGSIYALNTTKEMPETLQLGLLVGFCGGFTTFSAYALQTVVMLEKGKLFSAVLYLIFSPALGLLAAYTPLFLLRRFSL